MPPPPRPPTFEFESVAPGRVCLFGEHQDYLGLPAIALATPEECMACRIRVSVRRRRRAEARAGPRRQGGGEEEEEEEEEKGQRDDLVGDAPRRKPGRTILRLRAPAESSLSSSPSSGGPSFVTREYDLGDLPPRRNPPPPGAEEEGPPPDFALSAILEALEDGWKFDLSSLLAGGHEDAVDVVADCASTTTIPLRAGCSSSTAFCVAWVRALAVLSGNSSLAPLEAARLAHRAEVAHFGLPGGTMDHVAIAVGGLLRIGGCNEGGEDGEDSLWSYETLLPPPSRGGRWPGAWVVGDSGEPKDTFRHLTRCKADRLRLLERLGGSWDAEASGLSESDAVLLEATRTNRDTEAEAAELLRPRSHSDGAADDDNNNLGRRLGSLMSRHHAALRDGLGLSTDRIEAMREAALGGGAWGFKVVGSGGGGCAVAWSSTERAEGVAGAMLRAGAARTWIVPGPGGGARVVYHTRP
jgi:galactokinase